MREIKRNAQSKNKFISPLKRLATTHDCPSHAMQNDIYCAPDASYSELPAGPSSTCSVCVSRKDFSHDSLSLDVNSPASEMFSHRLVGYSSHVPILPYAPSISRPPRGLYAPFQLNNPAYPRGGRALFSLSPDVHRYSLPVKQETAKECAEHDLQTKRTLQTSATMSYSEASVSDWEKSHGKRTLIDISSAIFGKDIFTGEC